MTTNRVQRTQVDLYSVYVPVCAELVLVAIDQAIIDSIKQHFVALAETWKVISQSDSKSAYHDGHWCVRAV